MIPKNLEWQIKIANNPMISDNLPRSKFIVKKGGKDLIFRQVDLRLFL